LLENDRIFQPRSAPHFGSAVATTRRKSRARRFASSLCSFDQKEVTSLLAFQRGVCMQFLHPVCLSAQSLLLAKGERERNHHFFRKKSSYSLMKRQKALLLFKCRRTNHNKKNLTFLKDW